MTTSIAGIDVSEFQGYIDWQQVKNSGIEFAFIRIGCRTYDDGGIIFDERFKENLYSADRAGIKTGVYFFSQALTVEEATEEADAVIKAIEPFNITYPVVFDWEVIAEDYARTDDISIESLADCCVAFCERIKEAGYTPMIYQNKSTLLFKVDLPRVKEYDIWLAEYNDEPTYYYDFKIWQYTSEGRVPGRGRSDVRSVRVHHQGRSAHGERQEVCGLHAQRDLPELCRTEPHGPSAPPERPAQRQPYAVERDHPSGNL